MTFLTKKSTLKFFGLRKFFKISSYASDTVCVGSITLCARHSLGLRKFFKIRSYALVYIINLHTPKIRFWMAKMRGKWVSPNSKFCLWNFKIPLPTWKTSLIFMRNTLKPCGTFFWIPLGMLTVTKSTLKFFAKNFESGHFPNSKKYSKKCSIGFEGVFHEN